MFIILSYKTSYNIIIGTLKLSVVCEVVDMGDFLFSAQTYLNNTTKNGVINEGESVLTHLGCRIVDNIGCC